MSGLAHYSRTKCRGLTESVQTAFFNLTRHISNSLYNSVKYRFVIYKPGY